MSEVNDSLRAPLLPPQKRNVRSRALLSLAVPLILFVACHNLTHQNMRPHSVSLLDAADDILILGDGGAAWGDGTPAFRAENASVTWACAAGRDALALLDEENAIIFKWHPADSSATGAVVLACALGLLGSRWLPLPPTGIG